MEMVLGFRIVSVSIVPVFSAMASPVTEENSDLPSNKGQKLEVKKRVGYFSDDVPDEEIQRFYDELDRSQGFEIDFSKLTYYSCWRQLDLEDSTMIAEPATNRDLMSKLANMALEDYNTKEKTNLELGKILRTTFHPSAGTTFYISFEVIDGNQVKPYRAIVRYLNEGDHSVRSCFPKPSS